MWEASCPLGALQGCTGIDAFRIEFKGSRAKYHLIFLDSNAREPTPQTSRLNPDISGNSTIQVGLGFTAGSQTTTIPVRWSSSIGWVTKSSTFSSCPRCDV